MAEQIKVGDTVQLKSGGPIMTVSYDQGNNSFECQWFLNGELKWNNFSEATLNKIEQ